MAMVQLGGLADLQNYFSNPLPTVPAAPSSPLSTAAKPSAFTTPGSGTAYHTTEMNDQPPPETYQPPPGTTPTPPTTTAPGGRQENALTQWARPQLQSAYRKYLGRAISDAEFWNYLGPSASTQSVQQAIEAVRTSPESAAYQQSHPQQWGQEPAAPSAPSSPSGSGIFGNWDGQTFPGLAAALSRGLRGEAAVQAANQQDGGGYAFRQETNTYSLPGGRGYILENGQGTFDWAPGDYGAGGSSAAGGNYANDPSTTLLINTILQRLEQLQHPVADPMADLYSLLGLNRIGELGGQPYTAGEDAALQAQYMNPLTEARDAAKQQAAERLSARGIGPTSGLFQKTMTDIDAGYERGVASASNARGVQAVNEKQRRADEQLAILHDLVSQGSTSRSEQEARWRELVSTTALLPGIDEDRLKLLLAASGDGASSPSSVLSTLASLQQANTNATAVGNANRQANSGTWGAILGYILNNLPK